MDQPSTPALVERRIVEAFATLQRGAVMVMPGGFLRAIGERRHLTEPEFIALVVRLLAEHEPERAALIVWAKNRAGVGVRGKSGDGEITVPMLLARRGWGRSTFEAKRRRAARIVSDGINMARRLAAA